MESSNSMLTIFICLAIVIVVVGLLVFWFYREKRSSSKKLRELRDAISELGKD